MIKKNEALVALLKQPRKGILLDKPDTVEEFRRQLTKDAEELRGRESAADSVTGRLATFVLAAHDELKLQERPELTALFPHLANQFAALDLVDDEDESAAVNLLKAAFSDRFTDLLQAVMNEPVLPGDEADPQARPRRKKKKLSEMAWYLLHMS